MNLLTRVSSFPSRNSAPNGCDEGGGRCGALALGCRAGAAGSALLIVMMIAVLLLVSLTVALPSVYQEAQREREEELIFRGTQYARAIVLFRQRFRRFPSTVDELLETDGIRFLRKAYLDPMVRKGKWRFIHANAAGVILDSKVLKINPSGPPGAPPGVGQNPSSGGLGQSPAQQGSSFFGAGTDQNPASGGLGQSPVQQGSSFFGAGTDQNPASGDTGQSQSQQGSAFFGATGAMMGGFIVGVASTSHHQSIRIWNNRTHYDEWEFLAVDTGGVGMPGGGGGARIQPGAGGQTPSPGETLSPSGTIMPGQPTGSSTMPPDSNPPQ
jgi:hypothetical protein